MGEPWRVAIEMANRKWVLRSAIIWHPEHALLDAADVIIQVVTPETVALDVTRLASEAFAGIGYPPSKLQLLVNRADTQGSTSASQPETRKQADPTASGLQTSRS